MADDGSGEGALKSDRRVALGAARDDGEAENLSNSTAKLFRSLMPPARFYRTKNRKNIRRRYIRDWSRADAGRARLMNHSNFVDGAVGLTLSTLLFQKLSGDRVESVGKSRRSFRIFGSAVLGRV